MAADSLKLPSPFVASLYTFLFSRCIILYQSLRYLNLVLYLPFVSIAAFFRGNVGRFWSHELRRRMARRMMNLLNPRQLSYVLVPSSMHLLYQDYYCCIYSSLLFFLSGSSKVDMGVSISAMGG